MTNRYAITGASIGVGESRLNDHAVIVDNNNILDIKPEASIPDGMLSISLDGGTLLPGFIDLQVNGGGGVLFNNSPTIDAIESICAAHIKLGTCQLLVTLISCDTETTTAAIHAAIQASEQKVPGFLGLHLEGPHLSTVKRGAHNEAFLRAMSQADVDALCSAKKQLPYLMVTVAPEMVSGVQIDQLASCGIVVSLGHSDASFDDAMTAYEHGAHCATHLYNAMSPLNHREPGMVGAALTNSVTYCGLIADGVHVHPAAIRMAIKCKDGRGKVFLVSDAMATAGSDIGEFELDARTIVRKNGRLELTDGTLAGADTDMFSSVNYLVNEVGIDHNESVRMASSYPSACIGAMDYLGSLVPGHRANLLHIDEQNQLNQVWVNGIRQIHSSICS